MSLRILSADFAFYGVLDLLQRSIGFIMVPLYTRVLSQKQYGDLDILLVVGMICLVLVDLQFVAGFSRLYLEHRRALNGNRFAGTLLAVRLIGGTAIAAGVILAGNYGLLEHNFLPSFKANAAGWTIVLATVPLSLVYDILLLQTRMLRWKRAFAAGAISSSAVSAVFSVLLVAAWRLGIVGVVLGLLLGKFVGLMLLVFALRKEIELCIDARVLRDVLPYTLPLVPGWWIAFGSGYMARFFVYGTFGPAENAILAVCTKITATIGLFCVSFKMAWQPLAMAYIGEASGEVFYVRSMRLFTAGGVFAMLGMAALIRPILAFLAPGSYGVIEYYFPLFAVGALIGETEPNLQLGNQISKKTYWISISSAIAVAVNLAILIALTPRFGILAAGLGLAASALARSAITYVSAQKNFHISYDTRSFLLMAVGCMALLALGLGLQWQMIPGWAFSACAALLGIGVPWFMLGSGDRGVVEAGVTGAIRQGLRWRP